MFVYVCAYKRKTIRVHALVLKYIAQQQIGDNVPNKHLIKNVPVTIILSFLNAACHYPFPAIGEIIGFRKRSFIKSLSNDGPCHSFNDASISKGTCMKME